MGCRCLGRKGASKEQLLTLSTLLLGDAGDLETSLGMSGFEKPSSPEISKLCPAEPQALAHLRDRVAPDTNGTKGVGRQHTFLR